MQIPQGKYQKEMKYRKSPFPLAKILGVGSAKEGVTDAVPP